MACDREHLVHAYLDGELDTAAALEFERHLASCPTCSPLLAALRQLRAALAKDHFYRRPPAGLRGEVLRRLDREDVETARARRSEVGVWRRLGEALARRREWLAGAATGFVLASLAAALLFALMLPGRDERLAQSLIDAQLRSLRSDHLVDLASSDRHQIAPWMAAQADVAPPISDFADRGYALIGGRIDFVETRRVGVLVYRHGAHVINLFVWQFYDQAPTAAMARDGYRMQVWQAQNLVFCAVTDAPEPELDAFVSLVRGRLD